MKTISVARLLLFLASMLSVASPAHAQPVSTALAVTSCGSPPITYSAGNPGPFSVDTTGKLCANVVASVGGFTPSASGARGTPFTVTTSDSSGTLPTGATVVVANVGANPMYCNVNGVAATTSDQYISSSGGWFAFTIPAAITTLHCIATGSSTTANMVGGAGLATGTGGGSGGGGGGAVTIASGGVASGAYASGSIASGAISSGAVASGAFASGSIGSGAVASGAVASGAYASGSIASGAMVDVGSQADSACSTDNGSCSAIALIKRTNQDLTTLNTTAGSAIPAGTNLIGAVSLNIAAAAVSATNGVYTNLLQGNAVLATSNPIFVTGTGTAGSAATNPVTVQGIASMTPILANPGTIATWGLMSGTSAGTAPTNTSIVGAKYNATAPSPTDGQTVPVQVSSRGGLLLGNGYPAGSTPITISGTGTTGATTATLATGASVTTYICGFSIRANANAAATGNATVTGTITGTLNFTQWTAINTSGLGVAEEIFTPCIPASAGNTGIAVISAAPGTGGVVSVTAWGYTL